MTELVKQMRAAIRNINRCFYSGTYISGWGEYEKLLCLIQEAKKKGWTVTVHAETVDGEVPAVRVTPSGGVWIKFERAEGYW